MEHEKLRIGKEQPPVEASRVQIVGYEEDVIEKEGKKHKKLVLIVKHPVVPEVRINGIKFLKGNKLQEVGLWLHKDKDGNIPHNSAVAHLMRYCGVDTISGLKGKEVDTITNDKGYLVVKAY